MHIVLFPRKWVTLAAALMGAAAIFYAVLSPSAVSTAASQRQLPIYCVDRGGEKICAISFDAAWGADNTGKILDILAQHQVKATFFVVGNWADDYPDALKAIAAGGHEVMNHSNAHDHFSALSAGEIQADVAECNKKIAAVTGTPPTLIRCPFGEYDDHVIAAIRAMGMEPIQWDVDSLDWKGIGASEITERVVKKVCSGSIVLFHNAGEHTPEALSGILETLAAGGYRFVPVSALLLSGSYTIDHTGRQCAAE